MKCLIPHRNTIIVTALLGLTASTGIVRALPSSTATQGAASSKAASRVPAVTQAIRKPPRKKKGSSGLAHVAAKDLGVKENSARANEMARKAGLSSSSGKGNAWCAAAVSDWLLKRGIRIRPTAKVSDLRRQLKGYPKSNNPKPGAIVFYNHSHVGVVSEVLANGSFVAIEGNYSNRVKKVTRPARSARYFVHL